jgi:pentatricopeptide repeat protein
VFTPAVRIAYNWIQSGEKTAGALTSVIQIFGYAGLVDDIIAVMQNAKYWGKILNVYHFNAGINACKKHKRYDEALLLHELMAQYKIKQDIVTNSTMIQIFGYKGDWEKALDVFNGIERNHWDEILVASILSALEKNNRPEECFSIWNNTKSGNVDINMKMLNTVISSFCKARLYDRAVNLFYDLLTEKKIELQMVDKIVESTLFRAINNAKPSERVETIRYAFAKRNNSDYKPEIDAVSKVNFNELISHCRKSGDFRMASKAADSWLASQRHPTPGGITQVISIYGFNKEPKKIISTILRLQSSASIQLNTQQVNTCLTSLIRCRCAFEALYLFTKMNDDSSEYSLDLSSYIQTAQSKSSRNLHQFDNIEEIDLSLVKRDEYSYSCAFNALQKLKDWNLSTALLKTMPPRYRTIVAYNTVISTLGQAKQWREAIIIFNLLQKETSFLPDNITFYAMMSLLSQCGQVKLATKFKRLLDGNNSTSHRPHINERPNKNLPHTREGIVIDNMLVADAIDDYDEDEDVESNDSLEIRDENWYKSTGRGVIGRQASLEEKVLSYTNTVNCTL